MLLAVPNLTGGGGGDHPGAAKGVEEGNWGQTGFVGP